MIKALITGIGACVLLLTSGSQTSAAQECQARVLRALTDDLGNHWKRGTVLPVSIRRDKPDGSSYCASGGSCLPAKVNGRDAIALSNCEVGPVLGGGDRRLVPDPRLAGAAAAGAMSSRDAAERRLSALGFSNAAAGSLADDYLNRPSSANGRLVVQVLAGSHSALAKLRRSNP